LKKSNNSPLSSINHDENASNFIKLYTRIHK